MTNTYKHTPGPWFLNGSSEIHTDCPWKKPVAITFNKDVKAGSVSKGEAQANTQLIAAAPELLEALEWCEQVYGGDWPENANIREVIAKAKGE